MRTHSRRWWALEHRRIRRMLRAGDMGGVIREWDRLIAMYGYSFARTVCTASIGEV